MSSYTNLGSLIWEWEPFIKLDDTRPQILWLALYTTAEAKRIVPGLWHGSITAMADASKRPVDETMKSLDCLLEHEMVEYDQKHRVLRLTVLPDAKESPPNGNVLRGWFKRFKTVPACQVRDAHVATIAWLMNEWSRDSGKPISDGHKQAWQETFAQITIPVPRRRGVRRLLDASTGTDVQPGLFDPPPGASPTSPSGASSADESASDGRQTVSPPIGPTSDVPSGSSSALSQISENPIFETTVKPFANGLDQNGPDQDQDPDPDLDLIFRKAESGSGATGDRDLEAPRPRLMLVPMPTPASTTPEQLLVKLSAASQAYRPAIMRENAQASLSATIRELDEAGITDADLAVVANWIARHGIGHTNAERWFQLSDWASVSGNVLRALADAHEHERKSAKASAELAEYKKQLGYTT